MGHRLTRIVTRTGDDGSTGLGDGARVGKDAPRVAVMGDIHEVIAAGKPETLWKPGHGVRGP